MSFGKIVKCKCLGMQEGITNEGNKVKIAVCDDIMPAADYYGDMVKKILGQLDVKGEVAVYTQAEKLLESQTGYDIIILDIEMPDCNGLQVARELKGRKIDGKIIFLTDYDQYIQEAYKVQPFRYLYKSDPEEWIRDAIADAIKENEERRGILLESGGQIHCAVLDHILYIEALGDEIAIILEENEKYIVKMTLKAVYGLLGGRFVKCSRGILINLKHIFMIGEKSITLDNGMEIPMSYRERKNVKEGYREYIRRMVRW